MSDKIGKYYWVRTEVGKEIAFKRDSGLWEMHGVDCLEDCKEAILEIYGEVANGVPASDSGLHLQRVSNCASSCSFKEVKDIWNAAEKHVLHEMGEVCKGDANYEKDTPDLNTYYERHYY